MENKTRTVANIQPIWQAGETQFVMFQIFTI